MLDRKGKGRVALMLSDHAWLWARGYDGGGPHTDLLRRLSHWLMKEPDLEEEALRNSDSATNLSWIMNNAEQNAARIGAKAPVAVDVNAASFDDFKIDIHAGN